MVNNYPMYAAGVSFQKADESNNRHFYSAQVAVDPSDDSMTAKLTKDGEVISELPDGGGGGSSDFSTAEVTIKLTGEISVAAFHVEFIDPLTEDYNGLIVAEDEEGVRYFTSDTQEINLEKPSLSEETIEIYLYKNNPIYVEYLLAQSTAVYTITGSGEAVTLNIGDTPLPAVKVTGDCIISI